MRLYGPLQKPFLKWAGAKTRIVPTIAAHFPKGRSRLIEPFVGSAAVFLNTEFEQALLCDSNTDIINLYRLLKECSESFIASCQRLFTQSTNSAERYYALREEFNQCEESVRRAELFVYLNRHCFNGLCRFNSRGQFNTPFGKYDNVGFPVDAMRAFAERVAKAELSTQDFRVSLRQAGPGDLVYCDPPYSPLSDTANFADYASGGFTCDDHIELKELSVSAANSGAFVVISNHDTEFTRGLYKEANRLESISVRRSISCDGANRKNAREIIAVYGPDDTVSEFCLCAA